MEPSSRILILNWRDPEHPQAGGAEGYLLEVGRHWARAGHRVRWLAAGHPNLARQAELDGLDILRRGSGYGVFAAAAIEYLRHLRGDVDLIVDSENGIPFFSPLYSRVPKLVLVHHVHQEVFHHELAPPAAHLAAFLEARAMPRLYRRDSFVAVSESTRRDLLDLGVPAERVAVVHNGLRGGQFEPGEKSPAPTVLWLGRLRRYKCVDTVLDAAALWHRRRPDLRLILAGDGPERGSLERKARSLGLDGIAEFRGFVEHDEKKRLMQEAHLVVQTSMKEGWGMTVIESNACGTPVIASDVAGLRDSVRDGETGVLVPLGRADALADAVLGLIDDLPRRRRLERAAIEWASRFSWRRSAERWLELMAARRQSGIVPPPLRSDLATQAAPERHQGTDAPDIS